MHYLAYRKLRREWRAKILAALSAQGLIRPAPVSPAVLVVDRYSAGQLDWDNAYGGLKPVLDCLVVPGTRNPDGLGLIADDSPRALPFPPIVRQLRGKRAEGRTVISVYPYMQSMLPLLVGRLLGGQL